MRPLNGTPAVAHVPRPGLDPAAAVAAATSAASSSTASRCWGRWGPRRRHGSALIESLQAYIEANGRWAEAAAALDVHRHTLRYRIRKIEQLTGRDPADARDRLELWLALRAHELQGRRELEPVP